MVLPCTASYCTSLLLLLYLYFPLLLSKMISASFYMGKGSLQQRLANEATPKAVPRRALLVPRACHAEGRCQWPIGGRWQPAGAPDRDLTARAASCQSCQLWMLLFAG